MTVVSFTWWRELVEMGLNHRIVSISLRTGLMLRRLGHDWLSGHVPVGVIRVVTIVYRCWTRSAHLIVGLIGKVVIPKLRSGPLRWILRLVMGVKKGIWVGVRCHAGIGDTLVRVGCLLGYRAIGTRERVIRHCG